MIFDLSGLSIDILICFLHHGILHLQSHTELPVLLTSKVKTNFKDSVSVFIGKDIDFNVLRCVNYFHL